MKKLKLLLVALVMVALLVLGLTITATAAETVSDDVIFTVTSNGTTTSYTWADYVSGKQSFEDKTIPNGSTVTIYKTPIDADANSTHTHLYVKYNSTVTYQVAEGAPIVYHYADYNWNRIDFYRDASGISARINGTNSSNSKGFEVKLYQDVNLSAGMQIAGNTKNSTADNRANVYIDLNGHALNKITASAGSFISTAQTGYKNIYIFSSVPGGSIGNYVNNGSTLTPGGAAFAWKAENSDIVDYYIGDVTYNGVEYSGDNLSIYSGLLYSAYYGATEDAYNLNGGFYYLANSIGGFMDCVLNANNATFFAPNGCFIDASAPTAGNAACEFDWQMNFNNCVFYTPHQRDAETDAQTASFNLPYKANAQNSLVSFVNCDFILPNCKLSFECASSTGSPANVKFTDCRISDSTVVKFTNDKSDSGKTEGTPVSIKPVVAPIKAVSDNTITISAPSFALVNGAATVTLASEINGVVFDKYASDNIFKHNITLGSEFIYNIFVPNGIDAEDITVEDFEYEIKDYKDNLQVISIRVHPKKSLDEITVKCNITYGTQTYKNNMNSYNDQAMEIFADDAKLVELLKAVKDYAKATSAYFDYNAAAFEYAYYNECLPKAEGDGVAMNAPSETFLNVITGAKLRLEDEIAFVFTVKAGATGNVGISYYYNNTFVENSIAVDGEKEIVCHLKAIDINKGVSITVDGETLTYGLQNYIYSMAQKTEIDNYDALMTLLAYMENYSLNACPGHSEIQEIVNSVPATAETDGSYDKVTICEICGKIYDRETVIVPALLSDFTYTKKSDGTYTVTGLKEGVTVTELTFPEMVSEIAANAFKGNTVITKVTIPDTVTSLGASAFDGCSALEYAYVGKGITSVPARAFAVCQNLKLLVFSEGLKSINSNYPFYNGHVNTIIILPSTVETLSRASFQIAKAKVFFNGTQEEWIAKFGDYTDGTYTDGTYKSQHELDDYDGSNAKDNTGGARLYFYSEEAPEVDGRHWKYAEDGVTPEIWPLKYERENLYNFTYTRDANGNYTVTGLSEQGLLLSEITFPDKVVAIGNSAFMGNANLVRVVIPDTVKTIGQDAFRGCTALQYLTIGKGVTELPANMLYSTLTLKEVRVEGSITKMGSNVFYNTSSTGNARYDLYLPETIVLGQYFRYAKVNIHYAGTAAQWKAISNNTPSALYGSGTPTISIYDKDGAEITFD